MNIKHVVLCCLVLASSFVQGVLANEQKGPMAISLNLYEKSDSASIVLRQMLSDDTAVSVGFISRDHKSRLSGREYDAYELLGGYRKYLVNTDLRQYAEGEMRLVSIEYDGSFGEYKGKGAVLGLYYGLEYFVAKRFSLDGRAGVEHIYVDYDAEGSSETTDIPNVRLGMNFYW